MTLYAVSSDNHLLPGLFGKERFNHGKVSFQRHDYFRYSGD